MRLLLLIAVLLCCASSSYAQGHLGLFNDPEGVQCQITENDLTGILEVFVLHTDAPHSAGASFRVPITSCASLTWLADTPGQFESVIGSSPNGVDVQYGSCTTLPALILRISYFVSGPIEECCILRVTGGGFSSPYSPAPITLACNDTRLWATAGRAYLNGNAACSCTTPTRESTWGAIKSLYSAE